MIRRVLACIVLLSALLLGACSTTSLCHQRLPETQLSLGALQCRARLGDKAAAYVLGARYENAIGTSRSLPKARRYYRQAARDTPARTAIYAPGVSGQPGRVVAVSTGSRQAGLPEARQALIRLAHRR